MMQETEVQDLITQAIPNAEVAVFDTNGMRDHFRVWVSSKEFAGKNPIQRRQMVYKAVQVAFDDQRLHAVEITTDVPED